MTKTTSKAKKFKTAGLMAIVAGGLAIAGLVYNNTTNNYEMMFKKEVKANMTAKDLEVAIKECDIALNRLHDTIESDETNPEERFQARRAYNDIMKERKIYQDRLKKLNSRHGKTLDLTKSAKTR